MSRSRHAHPHPHFCGFGDRPYITGAVDGKGPTQSMTSLHSGCAVPSLVCCVPQRRPTRSSCSATCSASWQPFLQRPGRHPLPPRHPRGPYLRCPRCRHCIPVSRCLSTYPPLCSCVPSSPSRALVRCPHAVPSWVSRGEEGRWEGRERTQLRTAFPRHARRCVIQ